MSKQTYSRWFYAAAIYNVLWGVWVILFPRAFFAMVGVELPTPPQLTLQLWQCIGMFVLVFAIGYYCAGKDPMRFAPFILIGTLGKIFGPMGFAFGYLRGEISPRFGWTLLTNDLMWWPVFFSFCWSVYVKRRETV